MSRFGTISRCSVLAVLSLAIVLAHGLAAARAQGFSTYSVEGLPDRVSEAALVADAGGIAPGESVWLALHIRMAEGWHTYWRNPGDSGAPTRIEWQLPPGFSAGPVVWPYPRLFRIGPIANYGYEGEAWLLTQVTAPAELAGAAAVEIGVDAQYLVCAEICVPQQATLSLALPIVASGGAARPADEPGPLAPALVAVPAPSPSAATFAVDGDVIRLRVEPPSAPIKDAADMRFFPREFGVIDHGAEQAASIDGDALVLALRRDLSTEDVQPVLDGVLVVHGRGEDHAFQIHATPASKGARP